MTADNVMSVLYASKKYIIPALTKKCTQFLSDKISPDAVLMLLEQSLLFEEEELKNKVLRQIGEEADVVLSFEDFTKLSKEALSEVLKLNLKIKTELKVFEATVK